jgi:hypothetical protein
MCNYFSRIVFMNFETILRQIDAHFSHFLGYCAIIPTMKYSSSIGSEGYYVAQDLEGGERFVYYGVVPLTVTLDRCCQTTETCVQMLAVAPYVMLFIRQCGEANQRL